MLALFLGDVPDEAQDLGSKELKIGPFNFVERTNMHLLLKSVSGLSTTFIYLDSAEDQKNFHIGIA